MSDPFLTLLKNAIKSATDNNLAQKRKTQDSGNKTPKKRIKSGGKKRNQYDPNTRPGFNEIYQTGMIAAYKNIMRQWIENIKPRMEENGFKNLPHDFRDIKKSDLEKENGNSDIINVSLLSR